MVMIALGVKKTTSCEQQKYGLVFKGGQKTAIAGSVCNLPKAVLEQQHSCVRSVSGQS